MQTITAYGPIQRGLSRNQILVQRDNIKKFRETLPYDESLKRFMLPARRRVKIYDSLREWYKQQALPELAKDVVEEWIKRNMR